MEIRLEISHGQANVRKIALGPDSTIGRSSSCNLRVAAGVVSRRHCRIRVAGSDVLLRDLNSSNGTFIDGQRIPPEQDVSLPPDCELSIGGILFRVRYDSPVRAVPSQESTIEIPDLNDTQPHSNEDGQAESAVELETATDTPEPIAAADEPANDDAIDQDTDYDPAISGDTELAEPDDAATFGQPADPENNPLENAAAQGDTVEEIGFGFLAEAEAGSGTDPGSPAGDDDESLGDFLSQL